MKQTGTLLAGVILLCSFIAGQSGKSLGSGDVYGYLKDENSGEPLPYANIGLIGTERGTSTNVEGYFVLVNVPAGVCSLSVSYIGYESKVISINNRISNSIPMNITLKPKAIGLEGVEVVAERYEIFQSNDNVSQISLSPRELSVLPNLGEVDIFRSLQLLPGISAVSDGKAGLYVRGGTPDQNMVILDGMTVYHVDHFFGMFSAFNAEAIKDVQLYKGGFPAKYGGRLSSVIELTGKQGSNEKDLQVSANLLATSLLFQVPFWNQKASWVLSARRSYTDILQSGFYNDIYSYVTGEEATTGSQDAGIGSGRGGMYQQEVVPSFYYYDVNSKLTLKPTGRDVFSLSIYAGRDYLDKSREMDAMGGGFKTSGGEEFETRVDENLTDWGNIGASTKWAHQWSSRGYTNLLLAGSNYTSNYERDLSFGGSNVVGVDDSTGAARGLGTFAQNEYNNVNDITLRFDNQWQLNEIHKLEFGSFVNLIETDYQATVRDTIAILDISSRSAAVAAYVQDQWQIRPLVDLTFGFRSTYHDASKALYNAPRFSFGWMLTDKLKLKGAWGHYYQFINNVSNENVLEGSNDFWLSADEEMVPGFAEHFILGTAYETQKYLFEIEAYYKEMDNLVEFSRRYQDQSDYLNYFFFGGGISKGIEFLAQKKFGSLTGWASYTLGKVEHTFDSINGGESFPADHDRRHEVKIVGAYKLGSWNLSSTWVFTSGNAYTAPESQYTLEMLDGTELSYIHVGEKNAYRLPDYHRMDISISRQFEYYGYSYDNSDPIVWEIGLSIYNLYDHDNVSYRDYDLDVSPIIVSDVLMLGFTPTLHIKVNF